MTTNTLPAEQKLTAAQEVIDLQAHAGNGFHTAKTQFLILCAAEVAAWKAANPSRYCSPVAVAWDIVNRAEADARRVDGLALTKDHEGPTIRTWTAVADRHHEVTLTESLATPGTARWTVTMPSGHYLAGGRVTEDTAAAALHTAANRAMDASAASHI